MDIITGTGYRIGMTPREIGESTSTPDDFIVLDLTTGKLYIVSGGVWTDGGDFPNSNFTQDDFDLWLLS